MPVYETPRFVDAPSDFVIPEVEENNDSVLAAAFRRENLVVNAYRGLRDRAPLREDRYTDKYGVRPDRNFNAWDHLSGTEFEEFAEDFADVRSKPELEVALENIRQGRRDDAVINRAGGMGTMASMFAGFFDAPSLVPGFAAARGGRMISSVTRTATAAGTESLMVESALHQFQKTRTVEDSGLSVTGSLLLGGFFGGVVSAIRKNPASETQFKNSAAWLDGKDPEISEDLDVELRRIENRDLSAAATDEPLPEDFLLPTKSANTAVDLTPSGVTFGFSFLKAKSPVAQKTGLELVDTPFAISGVDRLNLEPAAEIAMRVDYDRAQVSLAKVFSRQFSEYRKSRSIPAAAAAFNRVGEGNLTRKEFAEQIAFALRRNDQSANQFVREAAQELRREVIDPLKDRATRAGLLPEDVKVTTAASYFTRQWDADEIVRRAPEFKSRMAAHFGKQFDAEARAGKLDLDTQEVRAYADEAADEVFKTLTGQESFPNGLGITVKSRGPLKERTLNVQDLDFEDFLNNDAEFVLNRYARIMSADIALKDRYGSVDMSQQIADINADYGRLLDEAKTPAERAELKAEQKRIVERLEAARDLVRGTYQIGVRGGVPHRVMQSAMSFNYIRALGGLVLSALPDVFRAAMTHGPKQMWEGAVRPLMANTRQYRAISKELADVAGIAEVVLNNRMMAIADITDPVGNRTPVENTLNFMSSVASTWSGGVFWNQALKEMATLVTTKRFRDLDFNKAADKALLQRLKVNSRDAREIQKLMRENGVESGGVFDPRVDMWPDRARDIYARAMRADADTVIVTPSLGDKVPVVEHHLWLKPAMQFKNFAVAAHSRVMVAGLQEEQARFLSVGAGMVGLGMFSYWLKAILADREPSDNPGTWVAEGFDRSGLFPLVMEVNNMWESLNAPGIYTILSLGEDEASRYAVRSTSGKLLGPTAGLINDSANVMRLVASQINPLASEEAKDIKPGDITSARRLVPFGRHPGAQQFLDMWMVPNLKEGL